MKDVRLSRRGLLRTAAITGAAVAVVVHASGTAQAAPSVGGRVPTWRDSTSLNGWPVLKQTGWHSVEGSGQRVKLADGAAAVLLTHVARRFNYEIDQLRNGEIQGHLESLILSEPYESNYLSGSAIAIRPRAYPVGVRGGLYPTELVVVRDILAELEGAVSWGGDFDRPKESHFEVAHPPGHRAVEAAVRRVLSWQNGPGGEGAGTVNAFDSARRAKAKEFNRRGR